MCQALRDCIFLSLCKRSFYIPTPSQPRCWVGSPRQTEWSPTDLNISKNWGLWDEGKGWPCESSSPSLSARCTGRIGSSLPWDIYHPHGCGSVPLVWHISFTMFQSFIFKCMVAYSSLGCGEKATSTFLVWFHIPPSTIMTVRFISAFLFHLCFI